MTSETVLENQTSVLPSVRGSVEASMKNFDFQNISFIGTANPIANKQGFIYLMYFCLWKELSDMEITANTADRL